jgi:hypothetical protein
MDLKGLPPRFRALANINVARSVLTLLRQHISARTLLQEQWKNGVTSARAARQAVCALPHSLKRPAAIVARSMKPLTRTLIAMTRRQSVAAHISSVLPVPVAQLE